MQSFRQDLRYAVRNLSKSPLFSAVVILTLALGIGANSAIFSVVHAVLLRPLPYADPDRLVRLWSAFPEIGVTEASVSEPDLDDWREMNQVFEEMGGYPHIATLGMVLSGGGEPREIPTCFVTPGFFETLGVEAALGRSLAAENHVEGRNRKVVLSHGFWQSQFAGDPSVAGRTVTLDGKPFEVLGVMPAGFEYPASHIRMWAPLSLIPESGIPRRREIRFLLVVARLKDGVTASQAQQDMNRLARNLEQRHPEANQKLTAVTIRPLHEHLVGSVRTTLWVLLASVGLVLLIACANVANLMLARSEQRRREMAVRMALGAGRMRLVRQLLTESLLLGVLGGVAGLLLAGAGMRLLSDLSPAWLGGAAQAELSAPVLAFTAAMALLTGILFGLVPALRSARSGVHGALQQGGRNPSPTAGRQRYRSFLVMAEVALVAVVTIAAGLMAASYARLLQVDPGFNPQGVLTMRVNAPEYKYPDTPQIQDFFQRVLEGVRALPQVEKAAIVRPLPLGPGRSQGETWGYLAEGESTETSSFRRVAVRFVGPDYFQAMSIPLLSGRAFEERDGAALLINQELAERHWPGQDAAGRTLFVGGTWRTVLGVVGNVRQTGLDQQSVGVIYVHTRLAIRRGMTLVARTAGRTDPLAAVGLIQQRIWEVDPEQPISQVASMSQLVSDWLDRPRLSMLLLGLFAALALVLAAVGVYGTLSCLVAGRRHEIGVRISLGAPLSGVFRLVVGQGMLLALVGIAAGLAGAFGLTRFMSSLLFEVSAADPATFAAAALLLALVAAAACSLPARRACKVDPIESLRCE